VSASRVAQWTPSPWLDGTPIVTGEASYYATYCCTSDFLGEAGVTDELVYLPTVGIRGSGHMLMLEKNNLEMADFLRDWPKSKFL
jgi:hypothetical protein